MIKKGKHIKNDRLGSPSRFRALELAGFGRRSRQAIFEETTESSIISHPEPWLRLGRFSMERLRGFSHACIRGRHGVRKAESKHDNGLQDLSGIESGPTSFVALSYVAVLGYTNLKAYRQSGVNSCLNDNDPIGDSRTRQYRFLVGYQYS